MALPVPPRIIEAFASNGGIYNLIPTSQPVSPLNAASLDQGFPAITMQPEISGGLPPLGPDMNGILFMLSSHVVWLEGGMPYQWDATFAAAIGGYPIGAVLGSSDGTSIWYNTTAANSTNPDAGGAGWVPLLSYGEASIALTNANVTLTAAQYRRYFIEVHGTLTGNVQLILPAFLQSWLVINNCTGGFTVTAKTASGTGILIPQGGAAAPTSIYGDGVNIQTTGISTAGLAPINSPTFTGTPAAPTPPGGNNTTRLATTQFVQTAIAPLASLAALAAAVAPLAPLASPVLTGVPLSTTNASPTDSSAQIATDQFVQAAILAAGHGAVGTKGYVKIGTIIIQWGQIPAQSDSAYHTLTFAGGGGIAFPNHIYGVLVAPHQGAANAAIANAGTSVLASRNWLLASFDYIMSSNWNIGVIGIPGFYIAVGD